MADPATQSYANHRRLVPIYHLVLFPVLVLNLGWKAVQLYHLRNFDSLVELLLAAGFIVLFFQARLMALTNQDRIIRLEERLRLERLLPDDLRRRIDEIGPGQLVALRFASDGELVELVRRVLDQRIEDRSAIKQLIRTWRPDHLRV